MSRHLVLEIAEIVLVVGCIATFILVAVLARRLEKLEDPEGMESLFQDFYQQHGVAVKVVGVLMLIPTLAILILGY